MEKACDFIVLGASIGGMDAIPMVLKDLPQNTPGILVVIHMMQGFTEPYAEWVNARCGMEVREARHGDKVETGVVLVAPAGVHMRVVSRGKGYRVECIPGEKVSGHCPSVDVLFHSAAKAAGPSAIGVIMTGMGCDGAEGLLAMRKAGAFTIGQDEASSMVYGMPGEAFRLGAVEKQVPCDRIAFTLKERLGLARKIRNLNEMR